MAETDNLPIVIFENGDGGLEISIDQNQETVWLTQEQISALFTKDRSVIAKHILNIFKDEELDESRACAIFARTARDGKTYQTKYYNLDMILSVGYKVSSKQATRFRQWSSSVLKSYLLKGAKLLYVSDKNSPLEGWQPKADGVFPTKTRFKKFKNLPFNSHLVNRARNLRKAGNLSEVIFWNQIKFKKLRNLDFERQKIIGNYIVDFYCPELDIVVEIDGKSHDLKTEYDLKRDMYLKSLDLKVLHFLDISIKRDLDGAINKICKFVDSLRNTPPPSEAPLKRGIPHNQIMYEH